jgi:hypothetical protein
MHCGARLAATNKQTTTLCFAVLEYVIGDEYLMYSSQYFERQQSISAKHPLHTVSVGHPTKRQTCDKCDIQDMLIQLQHGYMCACKSAMQAG